MLNTVFKGLAAINLDDPPATAGAPRDRATARPREMRLFTVPSAMPV